MPLANHQKQSRVERRRPVLVLDFGGVIAWFDHRRAGANIARLAGGLCSAENVNEWIFHTGDHHARLETGELTPDRFLAELQARFRLSAVPRVELATAYSDIFERNEPVCRLIARLPADLTLILASNTDPLHFAYGFKPQFQDILDRCDHVITSFALGVRKPAKGFFEHVRRVAGGERAGTVYVDDLEANIAAASDAQMDAILYAPDCELEGELATRGIVCTGGRI